MDEDEAELEREGAEFDREVSDLIARGKLPSGSFAVLPRYRPAFCVRCKRQITWEEYGLSTYRGRNYHQDCLTKWLYNKIEELGSRSDLDSHDLKLLDEYREALNSLR